MTYDEPAEQTVVYRLAMAGFERRISWTDEPDFARTFGPEIMGYHHTTERLWWAVVPRSAVLALITVERRAGGTSTEYIIDTTNLPISRVGS